MPDGILLELKVVLRPDWQFSKLGPGVCPRDVYLCERDPKETAARSGFLWHTGCHIATVRRICLWAERLNIPIVQEPSGNLDAQFQWPEDPHKPSEPVKASSALENF